MKEVDGSGIWSRDIVCSPELIEAHLAGHLCCLAGHSPLPPPPNWFKSFKNISHRGCLIKLLF